MAPTGGYTSVRNIQISRELANWNDIDNQGVAFDFNGGFLLPNGAMRAADAAWITNEKWNILTDDQREKFLPLCPDFVAELRSKSDSLTYLHEKMEEWMNNGCRLGWLIDPYEKNAYIYRNGHSIETVNEFSNHLLGEDVLPGFKLNLSRLQ